MVVKVKRNTLVMQRRKILRTPVLIHVMCSQISSRDTGKLIGKGGSTIRELKQKSGCQIELGEEGDRETDVHVYGRTQVTLSKIYFQHWFWWQKILIHFYNCLRLAMSYLPCVLSNATNEVMKPWWNSLTRNCLRDPRFLFIRTVYFPFMSSYRVMLSLKCWRV